MHRQEAAKTAAQVRVVLVMALGLEAVEVKSVLLLALRVALC